MIYVLFQYAGPMDNSAIGETERMFQLGDSNGKQRRSRYSFLYIVYTGFHTRGISTYCMRAKALSTGAAEVVELQGNPRLTHSIDLASDPGAAYL